MSSLSNVSGLSFQTSTTTNFHSHTLANDAAERKTKALEGVLKRSKGATYREQTQSVLETTRANAIRRTSQHAVETGRDGPPGQSFSTTSFTIRPVSDCGQCEQDRATMKCVECGENYCATCFTQFHTRGALQRHHYISLTEESSSRTEVQSHAIHTSRSTSPPRQNFDNVERRYVITMKKPKANDTGAETASPSSSRQEPSHNDNIKPGRSPARKKVITSMHMPLPGQSAATGKLPTVEFSTSKKASNSKSFTKTFRLVDNNTEAVYVHRPKRPGVIQQSQPKVNAKVQQRRSFSSRSGLYPSRTDTERSQNEPFKARTTQGAQTKPVKEDAKVPRESSDERHNRRQQPTNPLPTASPVQSNLESPSHEPLQFKSDDESQTTGTSSIVPTSPSTSSKMNPALPFATRSSVIDEYSIARFNLALDDIVDKTKLELANQMNRLSETLSSTKSDKEQSFTRLVPMDSVTKAMERDSPFSFSHSLNKTDRIYSASSVNAGDGAFFTDTLLRQVIQSPSPEQVVPHSPSFHETGHESSNERTMHQEFIQVPLRESSPRTSSGTSSSRSIILDETPQQSRSPVNNRSGHDSSLLSSSLHLALTPSEFDIAHPTIEPLATSSRKNSSTVHRSPLPLPRGTSSVSGIKAPSSILEAESSLSSSMASATASILLPPDLYRVIPSPQTTVISTGTKTVLTPSENHPSSSKAVQPSSKHMVSTVNNVSKTSSKKSTIRSQTTAATELPSKKTMDDSRQTIASDESFRSRKLEFSLGDGMKWQAESTESLSSIGTASSNRSSRIDALHTNFIAPASVSENDKYSKPSRTELHMSSFSGHKILTDQIVNIGEDAHLVLNEQK